MSHPWTAAARRSANRVVAAAVFVAAVAHGQSVRPETKLIESGFSGHAVPAQTNALPPVEASKSFRVPDDLEMELVLAEPVVSQPVFINFDGRGRLWVVQYLQYPAPAGLNVVSHDNFWRAVYDKVPEPPPRGMKGRDKITIHEDTDGDGRFDKHKTFVDGLNIATACVRGNGGVWVLNPPYLLFYPDVNNDDVPDGDPVVHLEGFGLEDTHSVVNSLRWGPDGWLYAAQGSTVTANVRVRPGPRLALSLQHSNTPPRQPVRSQGQNIWRYHPIRQIYEVFSEGGGNAFGVEIDPKGRIFSGHNGGDTRGFHYMQGAYLRKGFEKHGELSNPYAFGYFPHLDGTKGERFTHNFILYHGGALPERYNGKLFGVEPLQGRVVLSEINPVGSTFATRDLERVVTSSDSWFRPVDIKVGPDGAIYIADWYDRQVTHTRNQEGLIDREHGRIYRLKAKGGTNFNWSEVFRQTDGRGWPEGYLGGIALHHENQWYREQALRLVADGRETLPVPVLNDLIRTNTGQRALEALWLLNAVAVSPVTVLPPFLQHRDPFVRLWVTRLLADEGSVSPAVADGFARMAAGETNVEVRAQLASTAKRLPAKDALPIVAALLRRAEDVADSRLPLLCWWAVESKCESDRDAVVALFADSPLWFQPMVEKHILSRLMRRFAAAGTRKDLLACARLLDASPSPKHTRLLMAGFEEAFAGRALAALPEELLKSLARHDAGSEALKLRAGNAAALERALAMLRNRAGDRREQIALLGVLAEVRPTAALDVLLELGGADGNAEVRQAAFAALAGYDDARVPAMVLRSWKAASPEVRLAATGLIAARAAWSLGFVKAVDAGKLKATEVPLDGVRRMKFHANNTELAGLIALHWPRAGVASTSEMEATMTRLSAVVQSGQGNPYAGQRHFNTLCASCHTLFARGGKVGPDLTAYQRGDVTTMLLHVVNPSAEIREGYENLLVETADGRALNGFLVERDAKVLVLRGVDGRNVAIETKDITEQRAAGLSLMPEGLIDSLDDQQARDLFAYLRSTQPLAN